MTADRTPPLFTRYGFSRTGVARTPLRVEPYPQVCRNGALRATVLASAVDLVGGFTAREAAGTDATFTTDLSLRVPRPGVPAKVIAHATPLRVGRRLVTTEVRLESGEGMHAYGQTTFLRRARSGPVPDRRTLATPEQIPFHPLERPLDEEVGVETVDATRGAVRLALREALLNPEGVLQGALVALLAECASLALAEHAAEGPAVVTELDLRYLAAASIGPVESEAHWIGEPAAGMLCVTQRDRGRDDALTSTALVRIAAAPVA